MRIKDINDIETVVVHWSESNLINDEIGCDDDCDIEKEVAPLLLDDLISRAAKEVGSGYDKTLLSVKLKDGSWWCKESKFYLNHNDSGLMNLLNKGE